MVMASGRDAGRAADRLTVIGVFDDASLAEGALGGLRDAGFTAEQISVVAKDSHTARAMTEEAGIGSPAEGPAPARSWGPHRRGARLAGRDRGAGDPRHRADRGGGRAGDDARRGGARRGDRRADRRAGRSRHPRGGGARLRGERARRQHPADGACGEHPAGARRPGAPPPVRRRRCARLRDRGGDTAGSGAPILGQAGAAAGGTVLDAATDPGVGRPQVEPLEGGATRRSAIPETEGTGARTVITSGEMRDASRREGGAEG